MKLSYAPHFVNVAAVNLNQLPMDFRGNLRRIKRGIDEAVKQGATVVAFDELTVSGYNCERGFLFPHIGKKAEKSLFEIAKYTSGKSLVVVVGTPIVFRRKRYNAAAVIVNGRILGFYCKQFLARSGRHYEPKWFEAWPNKQVSSVRLSDGKSYKIGDIMFDIDGVRIGIVICQDAWEHQNPALEFSNSGMDLLIIINASHFTIGKYTIRHDFTRDISRSCNCGAVYLNKLGNEAGPEVYDGDAFGYQCGSLVGEGPRLTFNEVQVTTMQFNLDAVRAAAASDPSQSPDINEEPYVQRAGKFPWPEVEYRKPNINRAPWENSPDIEYEEMARALALGSTDYIAKCKLHGEMLCLSGGADSSTILVNRHDSLRLFIAEQGFKGFAARFEHCYWMPEIVEKYPELFAEGSDESAASADVREKAFREIMANFIHAVYLPGPHSSKETEQSARELAESLGATFDCESIAPVLDALDATCEKMLRRRYEKGTPRYKIARQSRQARVRGLIGWTLANFEYDRLLIPPSNMSEEQVGYWTEGGDNAGGANWIGGLGKWRILRYLKVRNERGLIGLPPIEALTYVNKLKPSAELEDDQTDEGELGSYQIRDRAQNLFWLNCLHPNQIFQILRTEFEKVGIAELHSAVHNALSLFCTTHWKRIRLPLSLRLEHHDLDPRGDLRWPVISSNLREELEELAEFVNSLAA